MVYKLGFISLSNTRPGDSDADYRHFAKLWTLAAIYKLMRFFIFILLLAIITSCNNSDGGRMPITQNPDLDNEFHSLLKEGTFDVEYYSSKEVTTGQKQLLQKLSKHIETNSLTQKYFRQIEKGESPTYNSKMGLSKQEYSRLIELFSYKEPEKHIGKLTIVRDGNNFKFQGQGRLSMLDSIRVVISNKSAVFKKYNMSLVNESIDLSSEYPPKGDTIEAYEFYNGPDGILGLTGLEGEYGLLIGKLKPSGRTYLAFFAKQPDIVENPIPDLITIWIN